MNEQRPLLMLPGTLCTDRTFAEPVTALAGVAAPSVVLPTAGSDLRGCAEAMLGRAAEQFALVGFSLGGLVALEVMRQAPERVLKLCLLATNPRSSTARNLETWARWRREAQTGGFPNIVQAHAEGVYQVNGEARAVVLEMAREMGPQTFMKQLDILASRPDSRPSLQAISCPTLLVVGQQDRVTPPELHAEMAGLIPGARLETLPACGHYAPLERPRAVSALLKDWLAA